MHKKILITLIVIIWAIYTIVKVSALQLIFPDITGSSFENKYSSVHFMAPGNNFPGHIFWLASKSIPDMTVILNWDSKTCTKQLRGIYFNSQRGKRLRPLDNDTLTLLQDQNSSYNNLQVEWWLYTTCDSNDYSIFGAITYSRSGLESHLIAGTKLNYNDNKMIGEFADSLQYFDNKVPIGYLYDSNGGIGYVGGELTGHENLIDFLNDGEEINNGFVYSGDTIVSNNGGRWTNIQSGNNAMETLRNLIIQGSVGLSKSITDIERRSLLGNFQDKTVIYNGSDINSSTLINTAKQNAQSLCQWKEINPELDVDESVLCYENSDLTIDLASTDYENKTIIVKNANVILQNGMNENSSPLNLFVDKGNLYLPTSISPQNFSTSWFPTSDAATTIWLFLKWNIIVNGLILWGTPGAEIWFDHKLHFQGKITILNTPLEPSEWRTTQITDMLWAAYAWRINLQKVFTRQCGLTWSASDGTPCGTWDVISITPLVILNGNYSSSLLK